MFLDHDDDDHPGQPDNMNVIERGETGKAQRTKHEPMVAARVRKPLGLSFFLPGQQKRRAQTARLYSDLLCSDLRGRTQSQIASAIVRHSDLIKVGPASLMATNPQHSSRRPGCLDALYLHLNTISEHS